MSTPIPTITEDHIIAMGIHAIAVELAAECLVTHTGFTKEQIIADLFKEAMTKVYEMNSREIGDLLKVDNYTIPA